MTVEAENFAKASRAPWIVVIAAYLGMAVTEGFIAATVCLAGIVTVYALIYAIGEFMGRGGYDLPESRKTRRVARQDADGSETTSKSATDLHTADRAA